jgi:cytoskeletal protein RodZ
MRRIVIALAAVVVGMLAFTGQATATYPPPTPTSPTPTPTSPTPTETSPTPTETSPAPTSASPTVKGTTTQTHSPSGSVLGKTVTRPTGAVGGTAFTGSDLTGPATLAAVLLVLGLALLYLGRRRAAAEDR